MNCVNTNCKWHGLLTPERTGLDAHNRPICGLCRTLASKGEAPSASRQYIPVEDARPDIPEMRDTGDLDPLQDPDMPTGDLIEDMVDVDGGPLASCNQEGCGELPAYRFTWPGEGEKAICEEHVTKLHKVAEAMSFHLEIIPLDLDDGDDFDGDVVERQG